MGGIGANEIQRQVVEAGAGCALQTLRVCETLRVFNDGTR